MAAKAKAVSFVKGPVACERLAITMRTLNRLIEGGMFSDARTDGGWRVVYSDELEAAVNEPDPVRRRAAVLAVRAERGRLKPAGAK